MPAFRAAPKSILRSFQDSHKTHLLITGSRGIGKSTLLNELLSLISQDFPDFPPEFPGFSTRVLVQTRVEIQDRISKKTGIIGTFGGRKAPDLPDIPDGCRMTPCPDGFLQVGIPAIQRAISTSTEAAPWAVIDEIGYLETSCRPFLDALLSLFDTRPVIAVLRKQSLPFLDALRNRPDVFVIDLDQPVVSIGCVIMASGLGKRFGSDKLTAPFMGKPLIDRVLCTTSGSLFADRIVVTRSKSVLQFCENAGIPVLFHEFPDRNDTVRLGLTALLAAHPDLQGCLFALGDQPLLSRETLEAMVLSFSQKLRTSPAFLHTPHPALTGETDAENTKKEQVIFRLCFREDPDSTHPDPPVKAGSPVLFSRHFFPELLTLPKGKGGSFLLRSHPDSVHLFSAGHSYELMDVDTPKDLHLLSGIASLLLLSRKQDI